ncbi:VanZ like family-domain-containing protein [Pyronema domesticum]|nr:VanZ like family-domain-containing protein [Pyronema domesticum]
MRIRLPFALTFFVLLLIAAYLGLSTLQVPINDKFLHFFTFFILTVCFYWILDTTRRRVLNFTLVVCTLIGGVGSEFLQSVVTTRAFDIFDILANLIGSGLGILLCIWYHKRMLDRRRLARSAYQPVAEDEVEFDQEAQELNDITSGSSGRIKDGSDDEEEGERK